MFADLNSELEKITDKYLGHATKVLAEESSGKERSAIIARHFYQLVNDLLDQTTDYMKRNNIDDTTEYTEIVQSELERFVLGTAEN
jgi:glutamyl-tRNA reductase